MKKPRFYLLLAMLSLGAMLAACGDSTATPAATPTAVIARESTVTSAAPTSVTTATTVSAATTAAATTAAKPTTTAVPVATTVAPVTTSAAGGNGNIAVEELRLPVVPPGFTSFSLNKELLAQISKELNNEDLFGSDNPFIPKNIAFLGTDISDPDTAGLTFDATIRATGYTFAIPGYSNILKLDTTLMGVYSKAGSPDLFVLASTAQDFLESNDTPDETPLPAELINFVKGKKYVFVVVGGTDIVAGISNGNPFPPGMPVVTKK